MPSLSAIGRALYGPRWQSAVARDLGVSVRTVHRWRSGDTAPVVDLAGPLTKLLQARYAAIGAILRDLGEL